MFYSLFFEDLKIKIFLLLISVIFCVELSPVAIGVKVSSKCFNEPETAKVLGDLQADIQDGGDRFSNVIQCGVYLGGNLGLIHRNVLTLATEKHDRGVIFDGELVKVCMRLSRELRESSWKEQHFYKALIGSLCVGFCICCLWNRNSGEKKD